MLAVPQVINVLEISPVPRGTETSSVLGRWWHMCAFVGWEAVMGTVSTYIRELL